MEFYLTLEHQSMMTGPSDQAHHLDFSVVYLADQVSWNGYHDEFSPSLYPFPYLFRFPRK